MTNKQIRQIIESPTQVLVSDGINPESNLGYYGLGLIGKALLGAITTSQGQETLSLVPGTDVQPYDSDLSAIAALSTTGVIERTGVGTATTFTVTANAKQLLGDSTFAAMRTTLELGSISTQSANNVSITGGNVTGITDLAVADGGTGASTAAGARTNLGLGTAATQAYEQGTWTPTIVGSTSAGTANYSIRVGNYTRIGDFVRLQFTVAWSGGTGAGSLRVSGLPFTSNGTANNFATNPGAVLNMSYTAGYIPLLQIPPGATSIDIAQFPAGGGSGAIAVFYAASGVISGIIFYQV